MNDIRLSRETLRLMEVVKRGNYIILDTETTGLYDAEIVQIALVNPRGEALIDMNVKPVDPIPPEATAIHGISDKTVAHALTWPEVLPRLETHMKGRDVVVYNASYDWSMFLDSCAINGMVAPDWLQATTPWHCVMQAFAEVYGDWNDYRQSYRWKKLSVAAKYYDIPAKGAHSALGDCLMTLGVVRKMCAR